MLEKRTEEHSELLQSLFNDGKFKMYFAGLLVSYLLVKLIRMLTATALVGKRLTILKTLGHGLWVLYWECYRLVVSGVL